jgi:hypothetical protein
MGNEELNLMQPATMFFHICNVDHEAVEADIQANLHNFYRKDGINYRSFHWRISEAREKGDWNLNRVSLGLFRMPKPDEWCVNTSRLMGVDSTDNESLTRAEIDGRRQAEQHVPHENGNTPPKAFAHTFPSKGNGAVQQRQWPGVPCLHAGTGRIRPQKDARHREKLP